MNDRVALVMGGGAGTGRATSLAFSREGARVVVADIDEEGAQETLGLIEAAGGEGIALQADMASADDIRGLLENIRSRYGALHMVSNNAARAEPNKPITELSEDEWEQCMAVTLKGVWLCMKYQIEQMLPQGKGAIINTTSFASVAGTPMAAFYCASKHGVLGLTRAAAIEYASAGIRINAVGPGATMTPMLMAQAQENPDFADEQVEGQEQGLPIGRVADAEELARPILFLASDDASYMVGHNMMVDGGMSID